MKPKVVKRRGGRIVEHTCPMCSWVYKSDERYRYEQEYCTECGKVMGDTFRNYCGNCGAKTEGEVQE